MIAALLGGVGCSSSGSSGKAAATPAASVPFPLAVGNKWKYKVTESPVSWTETDKVTSVVPVTGGQKVTMIQSITGVAKPFSGSYSASVSGLMRRAGVVVLCGGFESGRKPCVAVEEVAEGVELADAPFGGGGQVGLGYGEVGESLDCPPAAS